MILSQVGYAAGCATPRQLRLFAVGCCRAVWNQLPDPPSHFAVEVVERFADGLATQYELDAARQAAYRVRSTPAAKLAADAAKRDATQAATMAVHMLNYIARLDEATQLRLLLEVFRNTPFRGIPRPGTNVYTMSRDCDPHGNDFVPVAFASEWRTGTAIAIALGMYESRDFSAMPILADALQDAGCVNDEVLAHCRDPQQVHVRGCWVTDLVLGMG